MSIEAIAQRRPVAMAAALVTAMHLLLLWFVLPNEGARSGRSMLKQMARVDIRLLTAHEEDRTERRHEMPHSSPAPVHPGLAKRQAMTLPRPSAADASLGKTPDDTAARPGPPRSTDFSVAPSEPAASGVEESRSLDLQLHWPKGIDPNGNSMVQQALKDPSANSARLSPEQRLARALDQRVIEEHMGNGRTRYRRGNACVDLRPSHLEQIDPMRQSMTPAPKLAEDCSH